MDEKQSAYKKLDAVVDELLESFNSFDQGEIPVGYVLLVAGVRPMSEEYDGEDFDPGDEKELVSRYVAFPKESQMPVITRGIIESYRDRWR